jgi:XTP/dITP diphosphohydrolase
MRRLVLASGNAGKVREFSQLLAPLEWSVQSQAELNVEEIDEPFDTFVENALRKARNAAKQTHLPALADDSGVCVPHLNGKPGVYSARFAERAGRGKGDAANNAHLLACLGDKLPCSAYYYCVLVWVDHAEDPCPKIAEGRWWGEIVEAPQGTRGFGYDPHFYLPKFQRTVAQLEAEQKNLHSHRAQAFNRLLSLLA